MSRSMTRTVPLAVAALVPIGMSAPAGAAQPADDRHTDTRRAGPDLKVIESNIGSGAECTENCMQTVDGEIAAWAPDAVALAEVCADDVEDFETNHPGWEVVFRALTEVKPGCGNKPKGQMVAAPNIERVQLIDIEAGDTSDKDFGAACADIGNVWVCATHLTATFGEEHQPTKAAQVKELRQATDQWSKVVIAGDFNMLPGNAALDELENRRYVEADRADNAPTHGGTAGARNTKFDYIWFRKETGTPSSVNGWVVQQPTSGHDLLKGTVTW